jgi:hypothetical protein
MNNKSRSNEDILGPLQPHKKPRKKAKAVLAGLVAAAGIAGGAAVFVANGSAGAQSRPMPAGLPPVQTITTQPANVKVIAKTERLPGRLIATTLHSETQPTSAPSTQPATQPTIKAKPLIIRGEMKAESLIIQEGSTTQPSK